MVIIAFRWSLVKFLLVKKKHITIERVKARNHHKIEKRRKINEFAEEVKNKKERNMKR